jgi:hypothetical protein
MPPIHLPSRFLTTGLFLALLLTLLAWGFRQAPDAARQQLLVVEPAAVPVEPMVADVAVDHYTEQLAWVEQLHATTLLYNDCIQRPSRPKLPPQEEMTLPIYPGCEQKADYEDRVFCAFGRLKAFIESNKKEPKGSKRENVALSFVIHRQTGEMLDIEVFAGEDQRNIDEALRIVNLLKQRGVRWTPGTRHGEPINFPMGIPISFHGAGCGE